jgi:hypothetical protein
VASDLRYRERRSSEFVTRGAVAIGGRAVQYRRASGVVSDELDGHAVLLDRNAVRMLTLNPVGSLVWHLLDHDRTCAELATLLLPKVRGVTVEQLEIDLASFLAELVAAGVVVALPA